MSKHSQHQCYMQFEITKPSKVSSHSSLVVITESWHLIHSWQRWYNWPPRLHSHTDADWQAEGGCLLWRPEEAVELSHSSCFAVPACNLHQKTLCGEPRSLFPSRKTRGAARDTKTLETKIHSSSKGEGVFIQVRPRKWISVSVTVLSALETENETLSFFLTFTFCF